jgi:hypothetical protein
MAYSKIEPFGEDRDDIRSAIVAYTVATAAGAKRVNFEKLLAGHAMTQGQPMQSGEIKDKLFAFAHRHNAGVARG